MRALLLGLVIVLAGLIILALVGKLPVSARPPMGLATPAARSDLLVQATDAARQGLWPCDVSQLPDQGWSCIVVQVALANEASVGRGYDVRHFQLEDWHCFGVFRETMRFPLLGAPPAPAVSVVPGGWSRREPAKSQVNSRSGIAKTPKQCWTGYRNPRHLSAYYFPANGSAPPRILRALGSRWRVVPRRSAS